jgi:hypothetical protein
MFNASARTMRSWRKAGLVSNHGWLHEATPGNSTRVNQVGKCYTGAMCIMTPSIEQRLLPKPITMITDAQVPLCYESLVRPKSC